LQQRIAILIRDYHVEKQLIENFVNNIQRLLTRVKKPKMKTLKYAYKEEPFEKLCLILSVNEPELIQTSYQSWINTYLRDDTTLINNVDRNEVFDWIEICPRPILGAHKALIEMIAEFLRDDFCIGVVEAEYSSTKCKKKKEEVEDLRWYRALSKETNRMA